MTFAQTRRCEIIYTLLLFLLRSCTDQAVRSTTRRRVHVDPTDEVALRVRA